MVGIKYVKLIMGHISFPHNPLVDYPTNSILVESGWTLWKINSQFLGDYDYHYKRL